jgi:hypothetical protein
MTDSEPETPSVRDMPNSRTIAFFTAEFILRTAETISAAFNHDYEQVIIMLAITTRNSQNVMNDRQAREAYGSFHDPIPLDQLTPVSRMALARSTGLPRETVRRKVAKLIDAGWVAEVDGGLIVPNELSKDPRYIAILEPQAANLRRLFGAIASAGVLNFG